MDPADGPLAGAAAQIEAEGGIPLEGGFRSGRPRSVGDPRPQPAPATPQPTPQPAGQQPGQPTPAARPQQQPSQPQPTPQFQQPGQPGRPAAGPQPQPAGGQQQPAQPWTLRDQVRQLGLQLPDTADDQAAWHALAGQLQAQAARNQQLEQYARLGQRYLAEQMRPGQPQQQPGQPAPTPPAAAPKWEVPEYSDQWERPLSYGADGKPVYLADLDPSVAMKAQNYVQWQRDTLQKFVRDPIGTLKPVLDDYVDQMVGERVKNHLARYDEWNFAKDYVGKNADWMYQRLPDGRVVTDPMTGRPALSPAAQRFQEYAEFTGRAGVNDPRHQQYFAERLALAEAYERIIQQAQSQGIALPGLATPAAPAAPQNQPAPPAPGNNQPANNDQLRRNAAALGGARRMSGSGAQGANPPPSEYTQQRGANPRLSFGGRLSKALADAGQTIPN